MKQILETKRLILREFDVNDAYNFYNLNLNPNVIRYTGDKAFPSVEEAESFLANYSVYQDFGYGRWAVIEKDTEEFLGWCGLKFDNGKTDLGFRFFEEHWGKGYATESAQACLDYGFQKLGLEEIIDRAMKENLASIRVLEKIGMKYDSDLDSADFPGVLYKLKAENFKN